MRGAPLATGLLLAGLALLAAAAPALAQEDDTGWVVDAFDAHLRVEPDGSVEVTEEIAVDFGALERHGIYRVIPIRYDLAPDAQARVPPGRDPADFYRALRIDGLEVTSTAPAEVETDRERDELVIRIGDPDETVTGPQTYRLRYVVRGALDAADEHAELAWNVTGLDWPVPIRRATATVAAPAILDVACVRGVAGATTPCAQAEVSGSLARVAAGPLPPGAGMSVVAAFPSSAVDVPPPVVEERWRLARALAGSPAAIPLAAATAVASFGAVGLFARRGRDERAAAEAGAVTGAPELRFDPPEGLRPAQLDVLLAERVRPADVSATLADLAARDHLEIEQLPSGEGDGDEPDWRLRRRPSGDASGLLGYERLLLDGVFADAEEVTVSELRGEFSSEYERFRDAVGTDAVERGWFPRSPASTRARWLAIGLGALVVAGMLLGLALAVTTVAAAAVPPVLAAVALLVVHRWMPRRTAAGSALAREARGFRAFLTSAQAPLPAVDDLSALFGRYLPYAVAVGAVPPLVSRFAASRVPAERWAPAWYVHPAGHRTWSESSRLAADLDGFADQVGGGLSTAPASGSGAVSGAGFGGGGGGSW